MEEKETDLGCPFLPIDQLVADMIFVMKKATLNFEMMTFIVTLVIYFNYVHCRVIG